MTDVANRIHWKLRLGLNAAFGLIAFGFLLFMYHGDFLCAGPRVYVKPVLVLTIFASVWDAL